MSTTKLNKGIAMAGIALMTAGIAIVVSAFNSLNVDDQKLAGEQQSKAQSYAKVKDSDLSKFTFKESNELLATGDIFGRIYIPRLGQHFVRLVAQGVTWKPVLNEIGIGHYPKSQFAGEIGNFAVAAHRGGFGGTFRNIDKLTAGDHIYVETSEGWYDYSYIQTKIVEPQEVGVIASVPVGLDGAQAGGRYMTLTSCEPVFVNTHRIVVWFELVDSHSTKEGPFGPISWARD